MISCLEDLLTVDCTLASVFEDFVCRLMGLLWDIIAALVPDLQ